MGSSTQIARHRVLFVAVSCAIAVAGVFAASASSDDPERQTFLDDPMESLTYVEGELERALAEQNAVHQRYLLFNSGAILNLFASPIFAPPRLQTLYGCDPANSGYLYRFLSETDFHLNAAVDEDDDSVRRKDLHRAREAAGDAWTSVKLCQGVSRPDRSRVALILDTAVKLWVRHVDGSLSTGDLKDGRKTIERLKRRLLEGRKLLSCDAYQLIVAFDAAKTAIEVARRTRGVPKRRTQIIKAQEALAALTEFWRSCGSDCTDTLDNDEDSLKDASDPGCQTGIGGGHDPRDMSEQDFDPDADPPGLNCPTIPPAVIGPHNSFIRQPNAGREMAGIILRNVTTGMVLVERTPSDPDFAGGTAQVGDAVCGPGTTATVEWSVDRLVVNWRILVTKNAPEVTPGVNRVVVAANTR